MARGRLLVLFFYPFDRLNFGHDLAPEFRLGLRFDDGRQRNKLAAVRPFNIRSGAPVHAVFVVNARIFEIVGERFLDRRRLRGER